MMISVVVLMALTVTQFPSDQNSQCSGQKREAQGKSAQPWVNGIVRIRSRVAGDRRALCRKLSAVARYAGLAHGRIEMAARMTQGSRTRPGLHAFARDAGRPRPVHSEYVLLLLATLR